MSASDSTLPFIPFTRPSFDKETIDAVGDVLRSGWVTSGPKLAEFESVLSEYFGGRPVRCFANGTATMKIALQVAGIGPGDEVITTPISWVATSNVILSVGAKPIFVDIDPKTRNIDLQKIAAAITSKTRAIMPVYLAGLPVDMDDLYKLATQHGLRVIEDAAQAFGSSWKGKKIGCIGDLVSFSFQANKNLSTVEGGCLVLNNSAEDPAVLSGGETRRAALAHQYFEQFRKAQSSILPLELPPENFTDSNWHMFQIALSLEQLNTNRAQIMAELKEQGIGTGVHYPAITGFTLYRKLGYRLADTPIAERIGRSILTLPLFPTMADGDVDRIVATLVAILNRHRRT